MPVIRFNEQCYQVVASALSTGAKTRVDELLSDHSSESYSDWNMLKREPKKPTNKEVRNYLQHVHWLQELGNSMPDVHLPVVKLKQFTLEARALNTRKWLILNLISVIRWLYY